MEAFRPDVYRITNWPAMVRSETTYVGYRDVISVPPGTRFHGDDIDVDGQFGRGGYDIEEPDVIFGADDRGDLDDINNLPTFGPHIASLINAASLSGSLGFPAPSGAFVRGNPVAIQLWMYGNSPTPSGDTDSLAPPPLDAMQTATGSIYFGYFGTDAPQLKVEFSLTKIAVVPEPASLLVAFVGVIAAASRERLRRAV